MDNACKAPRPLAALILCAALATAGGCAQTASTQQTAQTTAAATVADKEEAQTGSNLRRRNKAGRVTTADPDAVQGAARTSAARGSGN